MAIKHATTKAAGQRVFAVTDWNANHVGTLNHQTEITNVTANQHHNESHTLASHSTKDHSELTNVTANQHHNESHTLASHSTKDHSELTNVTANQHHTPTVSGDIDHDATVNTHNLTTDIDHNQLTNTHNLTTDISHDSISDVSADDHHAQSHTLASHSTKAHTELTGVTANQHHAQTHTIASHDTTATGAELTTVADGATAKNAHTHTHASTTGRTANDHHNQSHTITSHSDTTATGAELNTLTDNSMADTLHRHSELSASDGTPDRALVVDATGRIGIGATPTTKLDVAGDIISRGTIRSTHASDVSKYFIMNYADAANYGELYCFGDFAERDIILTQIANVGIGVTDPDERLEVAGAIHVAGKITNVTNPTANQDAATKKYVDDTAVFTKSFTSADITKVNGGVQTIAHGLGGVPILISGQARCISVDGGYSVGDIVHQDFGADKDGARGTSIIVNSTNIIIRFHTGGTFYPNKTTTVNFAMNSAKWRYTIRAFR